MVTMNYTPSSPTRHFYTTTTSQPPQHHATTTPPPLSSHLPTSHAPLHHPVMHPSTHQSRTPPPTSHALLQLCLIKPPQLQHWWCHSSFPSLPYPLPPSRIPIPISPDSSIPTPLPITPPVCLPCRNMTDVS